MNHDRVQLGGYFRLGGGRMKSPALNGAALMTARSPSSGNLGLFAVAENSQKH